MLDAQPPNCEDSNYESSAALILTTQAELLGYTSPQSRVKSLFKNNLEGLSVEPTSPGTFHDMMAAAWAVRPGIGTDLCGLDVEPRSASLESPASYLIDSKLREGTYVPKDWSHMPPFHFWLCENECQRPSSSTLRWQQSLHVSKLGQGRILSANFSSNRAQQIDLNL